jgi:hypothetical protein
VEFCRHTLIAAATLRRIRWYQPGFGRSGGRSFRRRDRLLFQLRDIDNPPRRQRSCVRFEDRHSSSAIRGSFCALEEDSKHVPAECQPTPNT